MILAKLGNTDITPYINYTSYKMASVPVYNEWTNANYEIIRDEVRRRIKGSFDLAFVTDTDYDTFIGLINDNKAGNLLRIQVYVGSDVNALREILCYYDLSPVSRKEASEGYIVSIMTMNIEQR